METLSPLNTYSTPTSSVPGSHHSAVSMSLILPEVPVRGTIQCVSSWLLSQRPVLENHVCCGRCWNTPPFQGCILFCQADLKPAILLSGREDSPGPPCLATFLFEFGFLRDRKLMESLPTMCTWETSAHSSRCLLQMRTSIWLAELRVRVF